MAIESDCTGCGKRLRVADEHAGKAARCPACGNIYTVPDLPASTEQAAPPVPVPLKGVEENGTDAANELPSVLDDVAPHDEVMPAAPADQTWFMQTPEQRTYGPVTRPELDEWVRQGRVGGDCRLRHGEDGPWQWAGEVYGVLAKPAVRAEARGNPFAEVPSGQLAGSPAPFAQQGHQRYDPHRGGVVLTLGILAWVVCPLFGFFSWWMGSQDLKAMDAGKMDPSGRGMTQAGQILGLIYVILSLIGLVFALFMFTLMFVANL